MINTLYNHGSSDKHIDHVRKGLLDNDKHLLEISIDDQEWENLIRKMYDIRDGQAVSCLSDNSQHSTSTSNIYGLNSKSGLITKTKFKFRQSKIREKARSMFIHNMSSIGPLNQYKDGSVLKIDPDRENSVLAIAANRPRPFTKTSNKTEDINWFHDETFP